MRRGAAVWGLWVMLVVLVAVPRPAAAVSPWSFVFGIDRTGLTGNAGRAYPGNLDVPAWGVGYRHELGGGWRLRTGLEETSRGGSRNVPFVMTAANWWDGTEMRIDTLGFGSDRYVWSGRWLSIPVLAEKNLRAGKVRPFVFGGPSFALRVGGNDPGGGFLPALDRSRSAEVMALAGAGVAFSSGPGVVTIEVVASGGLQDVFASRDGPAGRARAFGLRVEVAP